MKYKIKSDLNTETKQYIKSVIKKLEKNSEIDEVWFSSLDLICDYHNTIINCIKIINEEGLIIKDRFGSSVPHPLIKVKNDAAIQLQKLNSEFLLTKKSEMKIDINEVEDESTLSVFLNNKKLGNQ